MPKTNFTKVEEVLEQGLRKYTAEYLLEQADAASGQKPKPRNPTISYTQEAPKEETPQLTKAQSQLIASLQRDLKRFQKKDAEIYTKLGVPKKKLKKMFETQTSLTPKDWETIKQIRKKIDLYKAEVAKELPQQSDDELVQSERQEHVTRRYNVNKKWLPLT